MLTFSRLTALGIGAPRKLNRHGYGVGLSALAQDAFRRPQCPYRLALSVRSGLCGTYRSPGWYYGMVPVTESAWYFGTVLQHGT